MDGDVLLQRMQTYALDEEEGFGWNRGKHEAKSWRALVAFLRLVWKDLKQLHRYTVVESEVRSTGDNQAMKNLKRIEELEKEVHYLKSQLRLRM